MADAEQVPMHPDFARWHNSIGIGDEQTRRELRWAGVSAVVQAAGSKDVETLVRLAFNARQTPTDAAVQKFRQAFKETDETFEMQGNDRELQVLAGASLATLMNQDRGAGPEAALAVTTASLAGARKSDLPMDLSIIAEGAISHITEHIHKRPNLPMQINAGLPKIDLAKAAAKVNEQPDAEGFSEALMLAAEAVNRGFAQLSRQQAKTVKELETLLRIQDEELQMLWWLTGQRSSDLDRAFSLVPTDAQPLVFAKELADQTEFLPGPASVKALLSRAGLKDRKKKAVSSAINAIDAEWVQTFIPEREVSPVSTPIHFGIKRRMETGEDEVWIPGWVATIGMKSAVELSPLMLGVLFYRERLLLLFADE